MANNDHEILAIGVALYFSNLERVDVDDKDASLLWAICRFQVSGRGDVSELRK